MANPRGASGAGVVSFGLFLAALDARLTPALARRPAADLERDVDAGAGLEVAGRFLVFDADRARGFAVDRPLTTFFLLAFLATFATPRVSR
jgi:hypothetical protein